MHSEGCRGLWFFFGGEGVWGGGVYLLMTDTRRERNRRERGEERDRERANSWLNKHSHIALIHSRQNLGVTEGERE